MVMLWSILENFGDISAKRDGSLGFQIAMVIIKTIVEAICAIGFMT